MQISQAAQALIWKKVSENPIFWYQCVALVKYFCKIVYWVELWSFGWSAKNWFSNPTTFDKIFFSQKNNWVPKPWTIIFFDNMFGIYGHTGVVLKADEKNISILEQNWWLGSWKWTWVDAIITHSYSYKNVIGWREPKYWVDETNILSFKNQGFTDGQNLDQMMTRWQAAVILVRTISKQSLEYLSALKIAKTKKIFDWSRENVGVTRQELAIMISRNFGFLYETTISLGIWSWKDESKIASREQWILMISRAKNIFESNQNFSF